MSTDNTKKELTAEEILSITEAVPMENSSTPYWSKKNVLKYMQEYASQQTASLQNVVHNLTKENLEYRERLKENVKSIESMLHHNKELTDQKDSMAGELDRVKKEVKELKEENINLTNQSHHDDNTICNFNDVIKEQQKELSELNTKYTETLKLFEELKQVALRCSDEVEDLRPLKIKYLAIVMENAGLKRDNEKIQNESFGFIIRGYYNRIIMNKPDMETVIKWLESDLQEIKQEDLLIMAKEILNTYNNESNNNGREE